MNRTQSKGKRMSGVVPPESVHVELEKAEAVEQQPRKTPVLQVSAETLASIQHRGAKQEIEQMQAAEALIEAKRSQFKTRILYWTGIFAGVGIVFLVHRYLFNTPKPPAQYVPELLNAVAK